eukprot:TRINITY_DN111053_c0_g1_i1.p1 TRINITY_DN111053_c0_g1~~TRINITY_DN111053_c0_g1_i1.p1  ORF type:complete len:528 (-),score=94.00 TRINITY_DN111053_c0_g1_i1:205-1788(-)
MRTFVHSRGPSWQDYSSVSTVDSSPMLSAGRDTVHAAAKNGYSLPPRGATLDLGGSPAQTLHVRSNSLVMPVVGDEVGCYVRGEHPPEVLPMLEAKMDIDGLQKIGVGKHGAVLLCRERQSQRTVVVKAISVGRLRQARAQADDAQLRREVAVMREVQHPNLVQFVDALICHRHLPSVGLAPPYLCIVMEHVADSKTIAQHLRLHGALPHLVADVVPQVASALQALHSRGFVHLDVWCENVLVSQQAKAVLVDLGCAENFNDGVPSQQKLNLPYMSPEAARGLSRSPGDDAWALGLLMTEMATARFTHERLGRTDTPASMQMDVVRQAIAETKHRVPAPWGSVCEALLHPQLEHRSNMTDVLEEAGEDGEDITSLPTSPSGGVFDMLGRALGAIPSSPPTQRGARPSTPPRLRLGLGDRSANTDALSRSHRPLSSLNGGMRPGLDTLSASQRVVSPTSLGQQGGPAVGNLRVGSRVLYVGRGDNQRYPGMISARIGGANPRWSVALDLGMQKEVTDQDAAVRLIPLP